MRRSPDRRNLNSGNADLCHDSMISRAPEHQATVQIRFEELELRPSVDQDDRDPIALPAQHRQQGPGSRKATRTSAGNGR